MIELFMLRLTIGDVETKHAKCSALPRLTLLPTALDAVLLLPAQIKTKPAFILHNLR